jgi:alkanesulfonate monooxygenase SsuD/methylene tetrahydromethanopterin reductase-like flavin-dependent oxidoreductase (luciferase family)
MKHLAIFQTPYVSPDRPPRETFDWLVKVATTADQLGFSEYWVGEHATVPWEVVPSPELVLAAAVRETSRIKLAPGAHLLPYHNPATLAVQVSWMTHLTQGRYILGIGAGAFPADAALRGLDDLSKNHEMMVEAIEVMQRVWEAKPFRFNGKYWKAGYPDLIPNAVPNRDIRPYGGKVQMGLAGIAMNSSSLKFAGTHGHLPLSIYAGPEQLTNHWEVYKKAADQAGKPARRSDHHLLLDVLVADTDAEARREAIEGPMGEAWRAYVLNAFRKLVAKDLGESADMREAIEFVADRHWIVGSPDTVVRKFRERADAAGGPWGTSMIIGYDYSRNPGPWMHSLELLAKEVGPRLAAEFSKRDPS